jgi:uncharacterized membrane protein
MIAAVLPLHILGGILALVFGYIALFTTKGATLHRKTGMGFVVGMTTMALTGALIASVKPDRGSIIAGLLTFYFVATGLLTVKQVPAQRPIEMLAMVWGFVTGLFAIWAGWWLAQRGRPEAAPMLIFSAMSIGGAIGDWKMLRSGGIEGRARIKRHLWRMCFAMWVAAASFFWGPPNRVPEFMRYPLLFPIPVLAPIAIMLYWLWKIRVRKTLQGLVGVGLQSSAAGAVK